MQNLGHNQIMSNKKTTGITVGVIWIFLIVTTVVAYIVLLRLEEANYNNFVNSEWPEYTIKYTTENSPLIGEYMKNLTTDDAGRVWIGTSGAINIVSPDNSWEIYMRPEDGQWTTNVSGNGGVNIGSVTLDRLGRTWVGTFDAIYVLSPNGEWTTYDEKSRTIYEHYTSSEIIVDKFDRVWVANNDSLKMFLPDGTRTIYTEENSALPDDYITALAEDSRGNIWVGTRTKGVIVIDNNNQWKTIKQVNLKLGWLKIG